MVFEVKSWFTLLSRNVIIFLISDTYDENLISSRIIEKLLQNAEDRHYCCYYDEDFIVQFKKGYYMDSADCKVIPSEGYKAVFRKPWTHERRASYKEDIDILDIFMFGHARDPHPYL